MIQILLEWTDAYLIGVEELDYEHQQLFAHVNELYVRLQRHNEKEKIEDCLENVYLRIEAHFALEETFMRKTKFKNYGKHKEEHDKFLDDMREAIERFHNNPYERSVDELIACFKHWVIDHILTSDRELVQATQRQKLW